jgi:hypothetical protein
MSETKNNVQKVNVVNFPKKDKVVTILSLTVSIISLIIASISTSLYIHEINKRPDLYVNVDSPTAILGKAIFDFGDDTLSKPLEFDVFLQNKGTKKSESLTRFNLMFDKKVEVSLKSQDFWEVVLFSNSKLFSYLKDDVTINPETSIKLGIYNLSIPPKQTEPLLIACFIIEGDFKRKGGLIYYDYMNEKYKVDHYKKVNKATEIWNKHLNQ